ncbi:hypothetical protein LS482_16025 [Sinomicrobium kalidii]|uniref:hypothetical protein n=1 Tax=Sinomicrobium kalidii TaxID=2900738 RepID=UPI001E33CE2D|nr:hypothetical protein [Sinomicrobium kalidii]UGU15180.1 hypothetical protein LS482_16025 [Sinomicrobium kalidii]
MEEIHLNQTVKIDPFLTNDPYNKRGETGKVIKIEGSENNVVTVEFSDGTTGLYDILALMPAISAKSATEILELRIKQTRELLWEFERNLKIYEEIAERRTKNYSYAYNLYCINNRLLQLNESF